MIVLGKCNKNVILKIFITQKYVVSLRHKTLEQ